MVPPFPERVHFIIRHSCSLLRFEYIAIDNELSSNYSVRLLRTCITALEWSESKPQLSISTRRPILGKPLGDLLLYINDRFSVTRLDVQSEGIQDNLLLQFLAQFHDLQRLDVWNFRSNDDKEHDMDRFLGGLPLRKLTTRDTEQVASFPHQVQTLKIRHDGEILTNSVWAATCNLKRLSELNIECEDIEDTDEGQDEEPIIFKSSNLRTLSGSLTAKTEEILRQKIIQPIFASCRYLTSVELHITSSLSSIFLALLLSKKTLVNIDVSSSASPYTFQEFAVLPKILPNLESLQLPWPASIGIPTNDDEGTVMDWRYERDRSQDVPDRLKFDQCQRLAEKYPKLKEIVFQIDTAEEACNSHWKWTEPVQHNMPFDAATVDVEESRRAQSFKIAGFIDEGSPCLDICSVFLHYFDNNHTDEDGEPQMSSTLFLSLDQIRKHAGKL